MKKSGKSGFTLVEISIVMVIIGLLAGGVLIGRDMIANAELRATIHQVEMYDTAFNTFLLKYNCIPGDCPNGDQFGFATGVVTVTDASSLPPEPSLLNSLNPVSDAQAFTVIELQVVMCDGSCTPAAAQNIYVPNKGNGNGLIASDPVLGEEWLAAGAMLHQAGLIKKYDEVKGIVPLELTQTNNPYAGQGFITIRYVPTQPNGLVTTPGNYYVMSGSVIPGSFSYNVLPSTAAFSMDSKIDDGMPTIGKALASGHPFATPEGPLDMAISRGPEYCVSASGEYNMDAPNGCAMAIKAPL